LLDQQIDTDEITYESDVVYNVINPNEKSYNYTDSNLRPYTRYGYRIETSTRAG